MSDGKNRKLALSEREWDSRSSRTAVRLRKVKKTEGRRLMSFEDVVATQNADIFTREFTYGSSLFKSQSGHELELCDGAVWIDDLLLLYQLKQRNPEHDTHDPDKERRWFEKKVEKLAVGQLADTMRYLNQERSLPLMNRRGQTLEISTASPSTIQLVILFEASQDLPQDVLFRKGRLSRRVGFVHYLHVKDYGAVCTTLHTPFEIADYLAFRTSFVQRNPRAHAVSEKALLGKYLIGADSSDEISDEHERVVDRLVDDREEFSISNLLRIYLERIEFGNEGTLYHLILAELAKLRRNMMREFRKRFMWAMEKCRGANFVTPSRFYPVNQGCSFIAIPLPSTEREDWKKHLEAFTHLCKYDFKSRRCIGFTVTPDETEEKWYNINWLYIDYPWRQDDETDKFLLEQAPFRKSWGEEIGKYSFT